MLDTLPNCWNKTISHRADKYSTYYFCVGVLEIFFLDPVRYGIKAHRFGYFDAGKMFVHFIWCDYEIIWDWVMMLSQPEFFKRYQIPRHLYKRVIYFVCRQ